MQSWQPTLDRTPGHSAGPLYRALADAIATAIATGALPPGARLPPQRQLARALGVDLTTITRGYAEAQRRGLLDATVGRGTFVRAAPGLAESTAGLLDMSMNLPPVPQEPSLRSALQDGLAQALRSGDIRTLTSYRVTAAAERTAAARWLNPVLGAVDGNRVLLAAGAQAALTALLMLLTRPGDVVLTDPLTYPGFRSLAALFGVRLAAVAADQDGLVPAAVEAACAQLHPTALYCVPTMHNPTTATLPAVRREALAEIALRHGVTVIEDDAYGLFPAKPLPALTACAPGTGFYLSTLAKCIAPGLRHAIVVAPDEDAASRLGAALRATSQAPAPLLTALLVQWLQDGTAVALRDAVRAETVARQAIARAALPAGSFAAHPEGLHVWLHLPARWNRLDFCAHVRRQGLALVPADAFRVAEDTPNGVRICLGVADSRSTLQAALQGVAAALRSDPPTHLAEVV